MGRPPTTPEPDSAFYVRLEEWGRHRKNADSVTIRELAQMLEVTRSALGAWKRAANNPRRAEARALSERTGIPWSELKELRDQLEEQVARRKEYKAMQDLTELLAPAVVEEDSSDSA